MDSRPASTGTQGYPPDPRQTGLLLPLFSCFFLSGFAALLYQIAWLRQFSAAFGTTELAVVTVLAAYMGGLAAGAALAARYLQRIKRPVLIYGLLEGGIALSALAVPVLLAAARMLYVAWLGEQPTPPGSGEIAQPVFYLLVGFAVLALPTALMGATLPMLTRHLVRADAQLGPRVAGLYATNTAGAVCGTLVAAFVLLPAVGLTATVWVGVGINTLVFVIAAGLSRRVLPVHGPAATPRPHGDGRPPGFAGDCIVPLLRGSGRLRDRVATIANLQPAWILPLMLLSGANAFLYEVLWTRMLAHVIGGSVYAFAVMLAAFLTGIALGGGLAARLTANRRQASLAFAASQMGIALLSVGIYAWMSPAMPAEATRTALALYAIAVMLPATIFIGATFPLAVRILAQHESEAGQATARIYSWNTIGAISGAILAGFVIIPELEFAGAIRLAVLVNLSIACWTALMVAPRSRFRTAGYVTALLIALLIYHPARPQAVLYRTGSIPDSIETPRELFFGVGRSSTVLLLEADGQYFLRTNGLPEASIVAKGGLTSQDATKWLGALPVVARPRAQDMLLIGLGAGVALEAVPPSVRRIDVIELEAAVIEANRVLAEHRNYDPLADPRVTIVINDARNALRLTSKTYDIIVSQPSHPWTAGASHLFTRNFMAEVKGHLTRDGVFVQWMNSEYLDEALLRGLAATLRSEFDYVRLYQPSAQVLVFLASNDRLDLELDLAASGEPLRSQFSHFAGIGLASIEDLLVALMLDEIGLANFTGPAPISTDDRNFMAMASLSDAAGLTMPDLSRLFTPHDPLLKPASWIYTRLGNRLSFSYLTRRLTTLGQLSRARALADSVPDPSTQRVLYGLLLDAAAQPAEAYQAYIAALRANPANITARYQLFSTVRTLRGIDTMNASEEFNTLVSELQGPAGTVVSAWRHQAARDWAALAALDAGLAASRPTDIWYPDAARLRAEWRLQVSQEPQRFAAEALELIDRALLLTPSRDLATLRLVAAVSLQDSATIVESCRILVRTVERSLRAAAEQRIVIPAASLNSMRRTLDAILEQLQDPGLTGNRDAAARVAVAAQAAIATLDAYSPP